MAEPSLSHLEITFAVGANLFVITPTAFDVDPARRDSGIVYCQTRFEGTFCKGGGAGVLIPEQFADLYKSLTHFAKGEDCALDMGCIDGCLSFRGCWRAEHRVAVFQVTMPAKEQPDDWTRLFDPTFYRTHMRTCVELEFWIEPDTLDEPLAETEAVLEHIKTLRAEFAGKYGLDSDEAARVRHWQP